MLDVSNLYILFRFFKLFVACRQIKVLLETMKENAIISW